MKNRILLTALLLSVFVLIGCFIFVRPTEHTETFFAMDTFMSVTAYGRQAEEAVLKVREAIIREDALWSVTNERSDIFLVNRKGSGEVDSETAELVSFALDMAKETGGALDPTVYPILSEWGFTKSEHNVPSEEVIEEKLKLVGYERANVRDNTITLSEGTQLDLGAVAKGFASNKAVEILTKNGVNSALIYLGGNIYALGGKSDGRPWLIGVQDPVALDNVGVLELVDAAAVTSGNYERYFTADDGTTYGHIIDPATGYPVDNDLLSVTVVSPDGAVCDALSTALFVMGSERAEKYFLSHSGFEILLITKSDEIIISSALAEKFTLADRKNYTVRVI